jgi:putative hydrolases of HD superfamily
MTEEEIANVLHIGRLAFLSGEVSRAVLRLDGQQESDTDHATMLCWLACSLAAKFYHDVLDIGLVAQLAMVHDACEIYAGDLYAVDSTAESRAAKKEREHKAIERIRGELPEFPWMTTMIDVYEEGTSPEARFVRAVGKLCPKIALRLVGLNGPLLQLTDEQINEFRLREKAEMDDYAADFPEILELRDQLHAIIPWVTT